MALAVPDALAPPPGNPRFPAIDGLRAIAALAVVIFHAGQFSDATGVLGRVVDHLDVGVAIFFAITGFLLYRPYFASAVGDTPRTPVRVFYRRRILRIVPAYWAALLVLAPIITFARPVGIANVLFLQIYRPAWVRSGIAPGWSVCVEMSFYLLLPLYAFLVQRRWGTESRRRRRRAELMVLGATAIASVAVRGIVHAAVHNPYVVDPLPTTFAWFCGGMSLAIISVDAGRYTRHVRRIATRHPGWLWASAGLVYLATLATHGAIETESVLVFIAYGGIAFLVLAPLVFAESNRFIGARVTLARPVAWLGLISYGIYLYHYPIMQELHPGGSPSARMGIYAAFGVASAIACGATSYYVIERPALKLKRTSTWHSSPADST